MAPSYSSCIVTNKLLVGKGAYTIVQAQFADRLTVKIGIELGQPMVNPKEAEKFIHNFRLDFIIGSLHNMEKDIDVGDYDYDKEDCVKVYGHYLEWLYDLAKNYEYDVLGHVTYPLRYMAVKGKYQDIKVTMPSVTALKWYKECGFKAVATYSNRKPVFHDIT